jgi:hypothetical protein
MNSQTLMRDYELLGKARKPLLAEDFLKKNSKKSQTKAKTIIVDES